MGCAIGMSFVSMVEIIYWIFLKPFGFPKKECVRCNKKYQHHYNSPTHKMIFTVVQTTSYIIVYFLFAGYRMGLVINRIYNPIQPDEIRNQIIVEKETSIFDFLTN